MRLPLFLPGLALFIAGCSDADAEKLRKVGDKTYDRAALLAQQTFDELGRTLLEKHATPAAEPDAVSRVQMRLKWDRDLSGLSLHVVQSAESITLSGTVKSPAQKEKAIALAEQTTGVSAITDELKVAKEPVEE